jgi:hypothetical protein
MDDRRFLVRLAVTYLMNWTVGRAHRLIGFGAVEPDDEPELGTAPFRRTTPQEAPMWAELATELRLRRITTRAAR